MKIADALAFSFVFAMFAGPGPLSSDKGGHVSIAGLDYRIAGERVSQEQFSRRRGSPDHDGLFRFQVGPTSRERGDPVTVGRAELVSSINARYGDTYVTTYWIRIPKPATVPLWSVIGQWHQSEDPGEYGMRPVLAFYLFPPHTMRLIMRTNPNDLDGTERGESILFSDDDFRFDTWHKVKLRTIWAPCGEGEIKAWWDGKNVADYSGPTGNNDRAGPHWQFGLYRAQTPTPMTAEYREPRIHHEFSIQPRAKCERLPI